METLDEALRSESLEQIQVIKEFRAYQGTNADYRVRAKIALGVIGNYVRLRATMANERSNDLIERRLLGVERPPKAIGDGTL